MNDTHDDLFDLHTFVTVTHVLVHPHTEVGYLWIEEKRAEGLLSDGEDCSFPVDELPEMMADADRAGLTVQQTLDSRAYSVRITTAPEAYDGFGTQTIDNLPQADWRGDQYRRVAILDQHLEWQTGRYLSGMYPALTATEYETLHQTRIPS